VAETILAKMAVQISANTAELKKALSSTSNDLKSFQSNAMKLAGTVGVAFGVSEVLNFGFEISKLAGEAEGVQRAFDKLPGATQLMIDLKDATKGTVSELDLMKRSVQAANFGISLKALPDLLEFAAVRAQQTGQSVDYLVDSIVTGIGRKSALILDNLGISAVELKKNLNGVSLEAATVGQVAEAVGRISGDALKTMGELSENASTKVQRLAQSWENTKVAMGEAANEAGLLGGTLDGLTGILDVAAGKNISFGQKLLAFVSGPLGLINAKLDDQIEAFKKANAEQEKQEQIIKEVDRAFVEFSGNIDAYGRAIETHIYRTELLAEFTKRLVEEEKKHTETLEEKKGKLASLNAEFEKTDVNNTKELQGIGQKIIALQAEIDKLEELRRKREELAGGQLKTAFGKEQAGNAAAGKNTTFTDFSETPSPTTPTDRDAAMLGSSVFPDITDQTDAYIQNVERAKTSLSEWGEQMGILGEEQDATLEESKQKALEWGDAIGSAVAQSIQGQETAAQALKRLTNTIVQQFLRQALGAIIASSTKSGGPPPVALALAAIGVAAVSAMFSKIGASGGGGGAASASAASSRAVSTAERFSSSDGKRIELTGEFKFDGYSLKAAVAHAENRSARLG
jgi:hypothetical protein